MLGNPVTHRGDHLAWGVVRRGGPPVREASRRGTVLSTRPIASRARVSPGFPKNLFEERTTWLMAEELSLLG